MKNKDKKNPKNHSPFLAAAFALDEELARLDHVTHAIDGLDIMTDKGMKRSLELLDQFNEIRDRIGGGMARLGQTLEETRQQIEDSSKLVAGKAESIQERQNEANELFQRFRALGESVAEVTALASEIGKEVSEKDSSAKQPSVINQLIEKLNTLVSDAEHLKEGARNANMKMLEQSADMLRQKIQATNKRLRALHSSNTPLSVCEPPDNPSLH